MRVHLEATYGFYHGQDPRTFHPDKESCTAEEIAAHKQACELAERGEWQPDGSGCLVTSNAIVCRSSFGIGVYHVVMTDDGDFVRDASFADLQGHDVWEEAVEC